MKKLNENDIKRFKLSKLNNDFYSFYKKTKNKKQEVKEEEEKKEEEEEEEEIKEEPKPPRDSNLFKEIIKQNPQAALINEMREKEINDISRKNSRITKRITNKSLISSSSSYNLYNNENEIDDFFSDAKVINIKEDLVKKKEKKNI